ncbi:myosin-9-like [Mya arenaria]|uniref:myosin-9-like n=1 Tax=Mya arenaria TaxID=6604 RepID=UPI0022E20ECC|nr:myosin-9-like [Mya arenaria]
MEGSKGTVNGQHQNLEDFAKCLVELSQGITQEHRNLLAKEDEYKRTIAALQEEKRVLTITVERLTEKNEQKCSTSETDQERKCLRTAELEEELEVCKFHLQNGTRQIQQLQLKEKELQERVKELETNLEKKHNEFMVLNSEKDERLHTMNNENNDHLKRLRELTNLKITADKEITRLKERVRELETTKLQRAEECEEEQQKTRTELACNRQELEDTKTRLSKLLGQRLTDANPNIADLSDQNRPTKLAERYSELYDNQWTEAFETLDRMYCDEQQSISHLFNILKITLEFCQHEAKSQMGLLKRALVLDDDRKADRALSLVQKQLKDCRKTFAKESGTSLFTKFKMKLHQSNSTVEQNALAVDSFLKECFTLCWLMCVQDPPVVFGPFPRRGDRFETDAYKAYTSSGPFVDFVVWPALYLHEDGPVLCKGIAQGLKRNGFDGRRTQDNEVHTSEQVSEQNMLPEVEVGEFKVVGGNASTKANDQSTAVTAADVQRFFQLMGRYNNDKSKIISELGENKYRACYDHITSNFGTTGLPPI